MEPLILLGLVGAGYLYNSNKEDQVPVTRAVTKQVNPSNGENIYHSEQYNEVNKLVHGLAKDAFDKSHKPDTKVVNFQK